MMKIKLKLKLSIDMIHIDKDRRSTSNKKQVGESHLQEELSHCIMNQTAIVMIRCLIIRTAVAHLNSSIIKAMKRRRRKKSKRCLQSPPFKQLSMRTIEACKNRV